MHVGGFLKLYASLGLTGRQWDVRSTTPDTSIMVANGTPGSPLITKSSLSTGSYACSSARRSPQLGLLKPKPEDETMQGSTPSGPFHVGDCPVGMSAITFGGFVVRSKTTMAESAFDANSVLPS